MMKSQYDKYLALIAAGLLSCSALAGPEDKDVLNQEGFAMNSEEIRTYLLNTLDNMEGVANGSNMAEAMGDQIQYARDRLVSATPAELVAIPASLYGKLQVLEVSSGQLRLAYDPALRTSKTDKGQKSRLQQAQPGVQILSTGSGYDKESLDEPAYPEDVPWGFSFEAEKPDRSEGGPDNGSGGGGGACLNPGTQYKGRVTALNAFLVADAVNNIAHNFCEWSIAGFNVGPLCVVTDVIASIMNGVNENQSLCNEHLGAAEVSATWAGVKTIHGNVRHVHDDLANVDSALSSHDTTIRKDIAEHDSDIAAQLGVHDTDIKTALTTHDTELKTALNTHDTDIKTDIAAHDAAIESHLADHDADIKSRLAAIQATASESQRLIKVSMSRQLEVLRLMITPQGRRELNPDVLSCNGDDCPLADETFDCSTAPGWPCK